jgi:putative exosortase-associated protein (TIGR04073 family)
MKRIICFFILLTGFFVFSLYAQNDNPQPKTSGPTTNIITKDTKPQQNTEVKELSKTAGKVQPSQKPAVETKTQPKVENSEQVKQGNDQLELEESDLSQSVTLREKMLEQNPLRKIARGSVNTTLGWIEIPRQIIKVNREKGDIAGMFWGPLRGFAYFMGRTAVGLYEVTTFLIPPYKPVVTPEFILSETDED